MTAPESVWGLVLAGGKSRRMGSDKALLLQNGETQLSRAVALLEAQLERVFVSTRGDAGATVDGPETDVQESRVQLRSPLG